MENSNDPSVYTTTQGSDRTTSLCKRKSDIMGVTQMYKITNNDEKNVHPHCLSRTGYQKMEEKMMKEKLKQQEEAAMSDPSIIVSTPSPPRRHEMWKRARMDDSGNFITEESRLVAEKVDSLKVASSQGEFTQSKRTDILPSALEKDEHPGRVRVVGHGTGVREFFGPLPRHENLVPIDKVQHMINNALVEQKEEFRIQMSAETNGLRKETNDLRKTLAEINSQILKLMKTCKQLQMSILARLVNSGTENNVDPSHLSKGEKGSFPDPFANLPEEDLLNQHEQSLGKKKLSEVELSSLAFLKESGMPELDVHTLKIIVHSYLNSLADDWVTTADKHDVWFVNKSTLRSSMDYDSLFDDKVINIYLKLLQKEYKDYAFVNCQLWTMSFYKHPKTNAMLFLDEFPRENFKAAKKIFVPINFEDHWFCVFADVEEEKIYVLDTIGRSECSYTPIKELAGWNVNELTSKNIQWTYYYVNGYPKQNDAVSCGPLMLKFMQSWAMGCQPSIPYPGYNFIAKELLILEIAMQRLLSPFELEKELSDLEAQYKPPKKLLIFDLNGVLVLTVYRKMPMRRPFYKEFLKFCSRHFTLAVWSSKQNINGICRKLLSDVEGLSFLFQWNQSYCSISTEGVKGNPKKKIMFKDLNKVWEEYKEFNPSNTVLIDDSQYKSFLNPDHNLIIPMTYKGGPDNYLDPNNKFVSYLETLAAAKDVQEHIKSSPFGEIDLETKADEECYRNSAKKMKQILN
ncbi:PREDICTED: uncharacterized protein LOC109169343 [Ipomoea nil]|uniref:uncharacterized protein LOC109169343 n=1 Tax=Ipomoea nil TaxID=35883 RepID=UPI0009013EC1|nr:PREDICTED: uncharacterized protein LOC109169343 [Ipomoea nil]XP_019173773.1 PREDICTED: uncharacterized protein LOC109169343 [Ipomoea nil]